MTPRRRSSGSAATRSRGPRSSPRTGDFLEYLPEYGNISEGRPLRFENVRPLSRTYVFERRGCCRPPDGCRLGSRRGQKKPAEQQRPKVLPQLHGCSNGPEEPADPKGTSGRHVPEGT